MEEIVKVISIDTRKSERSIKDLKKDIKDLKKELESTTIGSKEFDIKLGQLGKLQQEYKRINEEIVNSSKPVQKQMFELARFGENLAKSYSAINAAMGLLSDGNEDVQKALLKTSQMIQLIQGLSGFAPLLRDIPKVIDGFKGLFRWIDPVNQRISNIAAKIAGFDVNKLNALNGSGGGTASAAATGGGVNNAPVPNTTQGQKGFSAAIVQTNNDIEKQRQKIAELLEQHKQECDTLEDLVDKHSEQAKVYDTILSKQGDLMKMSERYKEIQKTAKDVQEGRLNLTNDQLRALAKEKQQIEETFKSLRSAVDAERDFAEQIEIAGGNLKKTSAEIDVAKNSLDGLEKQLRKAKWAKAIQTALNVASWITIILVIVQAVAALWKWIKGIETAASKQRKLNKAIDEGAASISAKSLVAFKELAKRYRELGDSAEEKKKFLEKFKDEIKETGLAINDINDADNAFVNNTDAYIKAIKDRAKAQAIENEAVRIYQEYLEERAKKENSRKGRQRAEDKKLAQDLVGAGVMTQAEADMVGETTNLGKKLQKMEDEVEATLDRLFEEMFELEEKSDQYFAEVEEGAGETTQTVVDTKKEELEQLKQYYNDALKLFMDARTRELQEVEEKYKEQIELAKKHNQDTTLLEQAKQREIDEIIKKYEDERIQRQKEQVEEQLQVLQQQIDRIRMMNDTSNLREPQEQSFMTNYHQGFGKLFMAGSSFSYQSGEDVENQVLAQITYNNKILELTKSRIEQENALLNQQLEIEGITADRRLEIERTLRENEMALSDAAIKNEADNIAAYRSLQEKKNIALQNSLSVASDIFGSMAKIAGEETKAGKAFAVTQAVIDTYAAANSAYASMAGIPYVGPALGIAAAAAAIASGIANVKTILSTKVSATETSVNLPSGSAVTPPALSMPPIEYTRNLLGNKETDELNKPTKVYVLESDITDAQNRVKVTEDNASF